MKINKFGLKGRVPGVPLDPSLQSQLDSSDTNLRGDRNDEKNP